ncbi:MAG TPA: hypothetical protein VFM86_00305 [Pedococcus sp.]|nr:hypothetical protein [Pedococcus sp.]
MSLEELGRSAAADLWADTERTLDVEARLRDLRRDRTRGRVGWIVAAAAAAAIVLIVVTAPWPRRQALPATPRPPARVEWLVFQNGRSGLSVVGGSLPTLTAKVKSDVPTPMAFSPDGSTLAFSAGGVLNLLDVTTGADRKLGPCRQPSCPVAWSPDSKQLVTASPHGLVRVPVNGGPASAVALPAGWSVTGLHVNAAGLVALTGIAEGEGAVMTVELSGEHPEVIFKWRHYSLGDPRWSQDGTHFSYLRWREKQWNPDAAGAISVDSIRADGQDLHQVAQVGTCYCTSDLRPWMDVSPSGRLVVSTLDPERRVLVEVSQDGHLTTMVPAIAAGPPGESGPVAWRSQPTGTGP